MRSYQQIEADFDWVAVRKGKLVVAASITAMYNDGSERILGAYLLWWLLFLSLCSVLVGCDSGQDNLMHCQGRVSFRGSPVPKGRIEFMPDVAKGNRGAAGYAWIDNGMFDTASNGRAVVVGHQVARIQGFDGVPTNVDGGELGRELFPACEIKLEAKLGQTQYEIEIP